MCVSCFGSVTQFCVSVLSVPNPDPKVCGQRFHPKFVSVLSQAKDVPSRSSEFAHPDVLIGLTALAYHIEGLRLSDLRRAIAALKTR
jgi:hypothetical protein